MEVLQTMAHLPNARLAIVVGAITVLGVMGAGIALAQSAETPAAALSSRPAAEAPSPTAPRAATRQERRQRVVHLEATVQLPQGGFATVAVDRGTVTAVGGGSIEPRAGDRRRGHDRAPTIGRRSGADGSRRRSPTSRSASQVVVRSRLEDGAFVARRIVLAASEPVASPAP